MTESPKSQHSSQINIHDQLQDAESLVSTQFNIPELELIEWNQDEYLFVMEFMETMELKYAKSVLKYESQHPEIKVDRSALCKRYSLDENSKVPLIVQLIKERLSS